MSTFSDKFKQMIRLIAGIYRDDPTPVSDGEPVSLNLDSIGRVRISSTPSEPLPVTIYGGASTPVSASESTVAEGNNSLTGLAADYIITQLSISTASTDWTLTIYSKDDYTTDELVFLQNRNGNVIYLPSYSYEDKDGTTEFHYNFTDNTGGSATHDIQLSGQT